MDIIGDGLKSGGNNMFKFEKLLFNRFPLVDDGGATSGGADDGLQDDDLSEENIEELLDETEEEVEETEEEVEEDTEETTVKTFTQEELDTIIEKRLARERNKQETQQRQQQEEQRQQDEDTQHLQGVYQQEYDQWISLGYEEEAAKTRANREVQREQRLLKAERAVENQSRQSQVNTKIFQYSQDKSVQLAKNPLAAKYVAEIDSFSQNGAAVDFETAMKYILGEKVANGEILNDVKAATEQRTLKNVNQRQKTKVLNGSTSGDTSSRSSLSREEKLAASLLGVSPKEYAAQKSKKR